MTTQRAWEIAYNNLKAQHELNVAVIRGEAWGDPEVAKYMTFVLEVAIWEMLHEEPMYEDPEGSAARGNE